MSRCAAVRRLLLISTIGLLLWSTAAVGEPPDAGVEIELPDGSPIGLNFVAEPPLGGCQPALHTGKWQAWDCSGYRLLVAVEPTDGGHAVRFALDRSDQSPFTLLEYGLRAAARFEGGDAVFSYGKLVHRGVMYTDLEKPFELASAANVGIPYLALVDAQGLNRLALGLVTQNGNAWMEGMVTGEDTYTASVRRFNDGTSTAQFQDGYFVSRTHGHWFQTARDYTSSVDRARGYEPLPIPRGAYDPTYDSWYWTSDQIDQELLWQLATRSESLGFRNFMIDAGWDVPAGEYPRWLDGSTGDYRPPLESFPDFRGLVRQIQATLGMKVMLWMQPYALGRRSIYYPEIGHGLAGVIDEETGEVEETPALCPRVPEVRQHIATLVGRVMDEFRPDAFWLDWQEDIPGACAAAHLHYPQDFGTAYNASQQGVLDAMRRRSPEVFVDMRWPYANLNNKPYTHLWQAIDTPGDHELMRLRSMVMRPFAAGVLMGTDEMYWDPRVSDTEAARFMAAVVFSGVPYFGPNILAEPAHRGEMLRAWLQFYQEHREALTGGDFQPYGDRDRPDQFIESRRSAFIYYGNQYRSGVQLSRGGENIFIVNASTSPGVELSLTGLPRGVYQPTISDIFLKTQRTERNLRLDDSVALRYDVPIGSLLTLRRVRSR